MPLELGGAFAPQRMVAAETDELRPPTIEDLRAEQLLVALSNLQDALNNMPAPVVNVAEPDLTAIVQAVTELNGHATAEDIARAIREEIAPGPSPQIDETLSKLTEALERLDFRMKGISSSGGGGTSNITSDPERVLGKVEVTNYAQFPAGGEGGASATSVTLHDPTVTTQKLAIDADGRITTSIAGTVPVSGTFWQATQPVSLAEPVALDTASLAALETVSVANFPATQPVSGTGTFTTKETRSTTGVCSSQTMSAISSTALAANANRLGASFHNEGSATVFLALAPSASTSAYTVQLVAGAHYEIPSHYTGIVTGVTSTLTATLRVTELT